MAKILTPVKAIRAKCLDCSCDSANEVRQCPISDCAFYPYRLGKNPNINKREYTEEQRKALATRFAKKTPENRENFSGATLEGKYTTDTSPDKKSPTVTANFTNTA